MIVKRLAVWVVETLCEALAVSVLLILVSGRSESRSLVDDLLLGIWGTVVVFMVGSGYVLTTAICGILWRSIKPWVYPTIAAALFVVHVQFFATGWDPATKLPIQGGGACIVFSCTYLGNWLLRSWVNAGNYEPSLR